jgi:fucose permease
MGGGLPAAGDRGGLSVAASYCAFILVGVSAAVGGVLLPAQMRDYGVDRTTIGITFFVFSAGFMLAGASAGALVQRLGTRIALAVGTGAFALSAFYVATRPAFPALVIVQVPLGYGIGTLESLLNAYVTRLPRAARRINRLHGFFGVGALLGPLLAAWMLRSWSWTSVWLVIAVLVVPLLAAVLLVFPRPPVSVRKAKDAKEADQSSRVTEKARGGLVRAAVRERPVLLAALFLAVYVGLEISVGSWGFSFLVDARGQPQLLAGYAVSGYWLGLTAGRFVISPAASRIGLGEVGMMFACLAGILAVSGLLWLASEPAPASAAFALLGFFLGPLFPTTMAITPRLTEEPLVPTAIGIINGVAVLGGSALPWLAGAITQAAGLLALLPFCLALALLLLLIWWRLAAAVTRPQGVLPCVRRRYRGKKNRAASRIREEKPVTHA